MRPRLLPFLFASLVLLGQGLPPTTWGPALYTLRATDKVGASLLLLDDKGTETVIDRDTRTASGGGLFSTVLYHATFYGAFTATPDLQTVVFTKHGKVKAPFSLSIGAFSGNSGGGIGYKAAFGEHDLEGIYVWSRATGKVDRLWDQDTLMAQLKAWIKGPEGKGFAEVDLKDEVRALRPTNLFHLDGSRFAWVNGATVFELDVATRTARILFSDLDNGKIVGASPSAGITKVIAGTPAPGTFQGTTFSLTFGQRNALTTASQAADGSLTLLRPGMAIQLPLTGPITVAPLGEVHRLVWNGPHTLTCADGEIVRITDLRLAKPGEPIPAGVKQDSSLLQPCQDGRSTLLYKHYKMKEDTVSKLSADGKVLWTTRLGDCRFGFLAAEEGDRVNVLVRRTAGELPIRVSLKADTGALLEQTLWLPTEEAVQKLGGQPAPVDLADQAVLLPCASGFLVWAPSRGEVEGPAPAGAWSLDPASLQELHAEKAPDGQWCLLTPQLTLRPLARRPLADQMVVLSQGRMVPVMNWINAGISQSSNPGDRVLTSLNKKPLAFFLRDFGFWPAPSLAEFTGRVVAPPPSVPAAVPAPATAATPTAPTSPAAQ